MSSLVFNEDEHPRFRGRFIKAFGHKDQPSELPSETHYEPITPPAEYTSRNDYYERRRETIKRLNAGEKPVPDKPDNLSEDESAKWDELVSQYEDLQQKADTYRKRALDKTSDYDGTPSALRWTSVTLLGRCNTAKREISNQLRTMAGLEPLY